MVAGAERMPRWSRTGGLGRVGWPHRNATTRLSIVDQNWMVDIELVVTDLDGTFWDADTTVHPNTLAAVADLEARGIGLLMATGRRLGSTREPLGLVGLRPPAIMLNGALCLDLLTGQR